jgi:hypothetical protein
VERIPLAPGREVDVPKATRRFRPWRGDRPADTIGGKALLDHGGRVAFPELAILWTFQGEGWDGVWLDSYRRQFRVGYRDEAPQANIPDPQAQLLARISEQTRAGWRGRWDVLCWNGNGDVVFAESKRVGRDAIRDSERAWLAASLDVGLAPSNFLVVEWALVG